MNQEQGDLRISESLDAVECKRINSQSFMLHFGIDFSINNVFSEDCYQKKIH